MVPIPPRRRKALLIGIRYTKTSKVIPDEVGELPSTHEDTEAFREVLINKFGYKDADITVMLDREGHPDKLQPTHINMRRELQNLTKGARAGDSFILYYAGHTEQVANPGGTEDDGKDEGMLAVDYQGPPQPSGNESPSTQSGSRPFFDKGHDSGMIIDDKLRAYLVDPLPAGARLTAIFDSCHSETLLDLHHYKCNNRSFPWAAPCDQPVKTQTRHPQPPPLKRLTNNCLHPVSKERLTGGEVIHCCAEHNTPTTTDGKPEPQTSSGSVSYGDVTLSIETQRRSSKHSTDRTRSFGTSTNGPRLPLPLGLIHDTSFEIPICLSPMAEVPPCNGSCMPDASEAATVVSVSACTDGQLAWDGPGNKSMSKILMKLLRENPQMSLREMMQHLGKRLRNHVNKMNRWNHERRQQLKQDGHSLTIHCEKCMDAEAPCCAIPIERIYQEPKIGGSVRLNLDLPFMG